MRTISDPFLYAKGVGTETKYNLHYYTYIHVYNTIPLVLFTVSLSVLVSVTIGIL